MKLNMFNMQLNCYVKHSTLHLFSVSKRNLRKKVCLPHIAHSLTMNSQKVTYKTSQKTSVQPRAFAGLNSGSSSLSSGELQQNDMFTPKTHPTHKQ